ncbi:MAG: LysE family transporter [Eubacteriales bacterium]|nr:LysE family transporter [Eubacteriales bacterium]
MFDWIPFLTYIFVMGITPGPNNIVSMSNGSRVGFRRGFYYNIGLFVAQVGLLGVCAVFCSLLSAYVPVVEKPLRVVGAAYLLWLAWKLFRSHGDLGESAEKAVTPKALFIRGIVLQFVNPKLYIYALVSMELYVLPACEGRPLLLLPFVVLLAADSFVCTICWLGFGTLLRRLFSNYARVVNTVMAALLVYCAVSLFL